MKLKAILLLYSVCSLLNLQAQNANSKVPEIPTGPLINLRAANHSNWSVAIKADTGGDFYSQNNAPDILNKAYTKTDKTIHIQLNANGANWDIWNVGDYHAFISPDGKYVQLASSVGNSPFYVDLSQSDFEGFSWINRSNFIGIREVDGKSCLVFSADLKMMDMTAPEPKSSSGNNGTPVYGAYRFAPNSSAAQSIKIAQGRSRSEDAKEAELREIAAMRARTFQYMAAVDLVTRLPVKESTPQGLRVFTFSKEPASSEQVPALVQNFIDSFTSHKTALVTRSIAPY